jgi:hypothetical protein
MAKKIRQVADELIRRFDRVGIILDSNDKDRLREIGFVNINGLECTIPNHQGANRFGVNVNKKWFDSKLNDKSKPFIRRKEERIEIDVNLFPLKNKLLALHYLNLHEYTLQLEGERGKWSYRSRWGMIIDESNESFHWVDNTRKFPLQIIHSLNDFNGRHENKTPFAEDLNEPQRILSETYRILRDTKISRNIKELYGYKCQLCGNVIKFSNGVKYAESHHIKPLGKPHNGPDVKENVICLCPNHHVLLDYGGIKLDLSEFKASPKHPISEDHLKYHNEHIFKTD